MSYEFRSNGRLEIEIHAETAVEHAFIETIAMAAEQGTLAKVTLAPSTDKGMAGLVLSMEASHVK